MRVAVRPGDWRFTRLDTHNENTPDAVFVAVTDASRKPLGTATVQPARGQWRMTSLATCGRTGLA